MADACKSSGAQQAKEIETLKAQAEILEAKYNDAVRVCELLALYASQHLKSDGVTDYLSEEGYCSTCFRLLVLCECCGECGQSVANCDCAPDSVCDNCGYAEADCTCPAPGAAPAVEKPKN